MFSKLLTRLPSGKESLEQEPTKSWSTFFSAFSQQLKFHKVHGKAIKLFHNETIAVRDDNYWEHSLLFSHRPVGVDEMVAIEITEISREFCGPLRIGFTSVDPSTLQSVPLGRDLRKSVGFWAKSVLTHPLNVGTTICFKLKQDGVVLYGINGQNQGLFLQGVSPSQPIWALVEAYGMIKSLKFINCEMNLFLLEKDEDICNNNSCFNPQLPQNQGLPLFRRRNVYVPRISKPALVVQQTVGNPSPETAVSFFSPKESESPSARKLCILCTESERNTAFIKCGHICMCYKCALNFQKSGPCNRKKKQICPICRNNISSVLRVYD